MVESSSNTWSGYTVRLLFLEQAKLGNLHTRAEEFAIRTGANVAITQVSIADWQKEVFSDAGRGGPRNFDGYSVKGKLNGYWLFDILFQIAFTLCFIYANNTIVFFFFVVVVVVFGFVSLL